MSLPIFAVSIFHAQSKPEIVASFSCEPGRGCHENILDPVLNCCSTVRWHAVLCCSGFEGIDQALRALGVMGWFDLGSLIG